MRTYTITIKITFQDLIDRVYAILASMNNFDLSKTIKYLLVVV